MTDKLTLKLNDNIVEITMDDNGRYCLNDLFKASGSAEKKKPYRFLNDRNSNIMVIKVHETHRKESYKRTETLCRDVDNYVMQVKIKRATKSFASRHIFDEYARFLGLVKIDKFTYETDKLKIEKGKPHSLYIIENDFGLTKIGITGNIKQRLRIIAMASGVPCKMLSGFEVGDVAYDLEQELHEKFKDFRTVGEWFNFKDFSGDISESIKDVLKERVINFRAML